MKETVEILQLIQDARGAEAIFADATGSWFRRKVIFFALVLVHSEETAEEAYQTIRPLVHSCKGKEICFARNLEGFWGLEFDGWIEDWSDEAREYQEGLGKER